ncbi:MAG TPA: hypothetical protein VLL08_24870 [Kineosporiaceae bacterium]|nr:hypothetical protein [Kineosporiaceae bacterium]
MRTRSWHSAITIAAVFTLIGIGIAVISFTKTSASVSADGATNFQNVAASSSPIAATSSPATTSPTASSSATATGSASPTSSATSTADDGSACADVFEVSDPAGDAVGELCTAVTHDETAVSKIKVTFTAPSDCTGDVMLRAAGVDEDGVEFGKVKSDSCASGTATASFTPISETTAGTEICGMLISDVYTGAQACVLVS